MRHYACGMVRGNYDVEVVSKWRVEGGGMMNFWLRGEKFSFLICR